MSLDVYLTYPREPQPDDHECNCNYCTHCTPKKDRVFSRNTTHNHTGIASAVGCYKACWRPDENGITKARQLVEPLEAALTLLVNNPQDYKHLEPDNGWGSVAYFTEFVREYLAACREHPDADVDVWR